MDIMQGDEQTKQAVDAIQATISTEEKYISELVITTDEHYAQAANARKRIKDSVSSIEERRKQFVQPLNDHVKWINGLFKPFTTMGEELVRKIDCKMIQFSEAKRRAEEEELRKIQEEEKRKLQEEQKRLEELATKNNSEKTIDAAIKIETKIEKIEAKPIEAKHTVVTTQGTTSIRKTWTFEILRTHDVPKEFCSPDTAKIKNAIKEGVREISGIRIYQEETIVSR